MAKKHNVQRKIRVERRPQGGWRLYVNKDGIGTRGWNIIGNCVQSSMSLAGSSTLYAIYRDVTQDEMIDLLARLEKELGFEISLDDTFCLSEKDLMELGHRSVKIES